VRPRPAGILAVLTLLLVLAACSPDAEEQAAPTTPPASTIRFASYDFPENQTLVEVYAQAARRAGLPVSIQHGVGPREVVAPALQQGVVDVVIDYLGTALTFARPTATDLPAVPEEMYSVLRRTLGGRGVTVLDPASAEDQNGFAVTAGFAGEHNLRRLSDLGPLAATLTFGAPPECPDRPLCLPGLEKTYGLHFGHVRAMSSRAATVEALLAGEIDVGLLETTEARLTSARIQLLDDDRGLQPSENVVPMVRTATLERWGKELPRALNEVSARLTTDDLRQLNKAVELDDLTSAQAAAQWWERR
jgi:osmoprotectant transport system substrate-binding protein